ncbi:MAG: adenylate kinase [Ruminococcaceae bacterium]|nr:adenylate kinase [Oscillospiraceae bacterium]
MVYIITGASHTGKTALAQKLLEKTHYPYLSIDHLKMGLIRSGYTRLTPMSDDADLTAYLWPIVREMIKTAIENEQHLIVEGCYIPCDWEADFTPFYREHIRYVCLVMSERYIREHFDDIKGYARVIEQRQDDSDCTMESVLQDNAQVMARALAHGVSYRLIDSDYDVNVDEWRIP